MTAPLHLRIRRELEEQIRSGTLPVGARLPTEAELAQQHGVGRATAQRVLHDLTEAGLTVRYRRRGTFVAATAQHQNLLNFVTPHSIEKGVPGLHEVSSARVVQAAESILPLPGAAPDAPVIEMVRRKLDLAGRAMAVERHVVLFSLAPKLLEQDLAHLVTVSYLRQLGVKIATSRVYLDPVVLDEQDANLLDSDQGSVTFRRRRHLKLQDGEIVEVATTTVRPGTVEFYVELPVDSYWEDDSVP